MLSIDNSVRFGKSMKESIKKSEINPNGPSYPFIFKAYPANLLKN